MKKLDKIQNIPKECPKKKYTTPKLIKLKSINKMTQAKSNKGTKDGATGWAHSS